MIINRANLAAATTGFQTIFNTALTGAANADHYSRVAMTVPSTTGSESYPWLAEFFQIREWLGEREYQNLLSHDFTLKNKDYEGSVSVDRNDIEDDKLGIYKPPFEEMGSATAAYPNTLVFSLLPKGFTSLCWDGQYFFDTDHPGFDGDGKAVSVSNHMGGAGTAWYLVASKAALKPVIYQKRRDFQFVAMDAANDEAVFSNKKYRYGVDGRMNVGFGMWQLVVASKQALTHDSYEAARAAFGAFRRRSGQPLGLVGDLLAVPQTLEGKGRQVLLNETKANGESNEWKGSAELFVTPWL